MRLIFLLFGMLILAGCEQFTDNQAKIVTPEEMQILLQNERVQLVDVRTPEEYNDGYIENAINIDYYSPTFVEDIEKLDKEQPILVYCKSGRRSAKCSKILEEAGFKKIYDLKGGFSTWKFKGFKIESK
ncbi:rhodanese-like domain-containing protein [Aestuariivivens sediminis]|uniref:rhodanese-like domain-containing protein n=1 Tax=Aestuariivivens sediminis TaxID=2913557 RepID=UPI001F582D28|nr:rhodanese-like domain-containing protein [Aestuariivivens sediminis]